MVMLAATLASPLEVESTAAIGQIGAAPSSPEVVPCPATGGVLPPNA
jgi:hypothetical protein